MRVGDIMSVKVETIPASATLDEARERMWRRNIRHLAVVESGALVGVVSRDGLERAKGPSVREAISGPAVTATPHTTIREAANLMRGNRVDSLPVLDAQADVVGIVTVSDLLDLIGKGVDRAPEDPGRRR
ncbi:MAG TPA: CBS domain-containing protein [Myxococcales bacterium]|nr:CBS domain-containing protein [Myxococcales bacterium]